MFKKYFLIILLFITASNALAQNDCIDAIIVCGNSGFTGLTATGVGTQELNGSVTCGSQENNSIWLRLNINTSGTLGFTLKPESPDISEDFDFFIFGPNKLCNNLGTSIRCSTTNPQSISQENNWTGMNDTETDVSEGPGNAGNSFLKWMDVVAGQSYFLVIDRPVGFSNFSIEWNGTATFNEPPSFEIPTGAAIDLKECDADGTLDGSTPFDLTQNDAIMIGTQTDVAVSYHIDSNDAITGVNAIANTNHFINTSDPQTIFARITNNTTGCFNYIEFTLSINTALNVPNSEVALCDDTTDGDDTNGQATFNFDTVTSELFNGQDISGLTYSYYLTQNDADTSTSPLPQAFHTQTRSVFIRVSNMAGCFAVKEIQLTVNLLPVRKTVSLVQCDTEAIPNGLSLFNLSQATAELLGGNPDLSVAYYENAADAQNDTNSLIKYTNTSNPQNIVAKITDATTGCSSNSTLSLFVNTSPPLNAVIKRCDVLGQENGIAVFDLTESNFTITPPETIAYYFSVEDALLEQFPIAENYTNTTPYNQTVFARIENDNDCSVINTVTLIVNKLPDIDTESDGKDFVCNNLPDQYITINAGVLDPFPSGFAYEWYYNGDYFPRSTYSIQVNKAGTYTVDVFNPQGCFKTRTIEVFASSNAAIESIDVQDITTDNNTVTINLTPTSVGEYEYSIDNPFGPFQSSNFFENVIPGIHEVYINDLNGCGIISQLFAVLGIPQFFTPNGDGFNDFWLIKGVDVVFNKESKMYIFDRFGKLVKEVSTRDTKGWDGTLNGNPLPADDYWYVVNLEDGRTVKGHFALKR